MHNLCCILLQSQILAIFINPDSKSFHMTIAMSLETIVPHDLAIRLLDVRHARRNSSSQIGHSPESADAFLVFGEFSGL